MAAKKHHNFPLDHPFIQAGLWPESLVFEVWPMEEASRRSWVCRNKIPSKEIGGMRWFHRDDIVAWFRKYEKQGKSQTPK